MIIHSLPITCFTASGNFVSCKCHVDSSNGVTHCADYFWLEGYSLYKGDPWNEWEAIGSQISPKQALDYAAGSWTCSRQNGQGYCVKLNIHPPGNGYGVDAALTDDATDKHSQGGHAGSSWRAKQLRVQQILGLHCAARFPFGRGPNGYHVHFLRCGGHYSGRAFLSLSSFLGLGRPRFTERLGLRPLPAMPPRYVRERRRQGTVGNKRWSPVAPRRTATTFSYLREHSDLAHWLWHPAIRPLSQRSIPTASGIARLSRYVLYG